MSEDDYYNNNMTTILRLSTYLLQHHTHTHQRKKKDEIAFTILRTARYANTNTSLIEVSVENT